MHILNGNIPDLVMECNAYEATIKLYVDIELFLPCIGEDSYITFNEPGVSGCVPICCQISDCPQTGSSLASRTCIKTLAYDTILANAHSFDNDVSRVSRMMLTISVATALNSHEVVVIVTGLCKSLSLSKAISE